MVTLQIPTGSSDAKAPFRPVLREPLASVFLTYRAGEASALVWATGPLRSLHRKNKQTETLVSSKNAIVRAPTPVLLVFLNKPLKGHPLSVGAPFYGIGYPSVSSTLIPKLGYEAFLTGPKLPPGMSCRKSSRKLL